MCWFGPIIATIGSKVSGKVLLTAEHKLSWVLSGQPIEELFGGNFSIVITVQLIAMIRFETASI